MYCSHCGSQTADNVAFCKNCGFRHGGGGSDDGHRLRRLALLAGTVIGCIGLIGFFSIARELLRSGMPADTMAVLLIPYLITLAVMFTVLVRHAFKASDSGRSARSQNDAPEQPQYFRAVNTAQLPDNPASVTEHTTRTLDEIPSGKH